MLFIVGTNAVKISPQRSSIIVEFRKHELKVNVHEEQILLRDHEETESQAVSSSSLSRNAFRAHRGTSPEPGPLQVSVSMVSFILKERSEALMSV